MSQQYLAKLYPSATQAPTTQPVLGICLSGGGSRALTCALGQLSALSAMTLPTGQPILSPSQYLSVVSGGSWAGVLYTFLPQTINGVNVSDADFLIQPVPPQSLTKGNSANNQPGNVSYMGPYCMGTTPQRFSLANIGVFLYMLWCHSFFDYEVLWSWFWSAGTGEMVLKPFGLYSATYDSSGPFVQPSLMFSLSTDEVLNNITKFNPQLHPAEFYLARDGRPSLIVNFNLLEDYHHPNPVQIPVQATPSSTSVWGHSPDGKVKGGGGVESFGFTSTLKGPGMNGTASTSTVRNYSLCDIAGCSSAFFAAFLLEYVRKGIDHIVSDFEDYLVNDLGWDRGWADWAGGWIKTAVSGWADEAADKVIPIYNYWPAGDISTSSNNVLGFSDGGDFDNSGILGLLAQTNANKIIAFENTDIVLGGTAKDPTLDYTLGWLFGYGGNGPGDLTYVQVFNDSNPLYPGGAYAALKTGLYEASCGGGSTPGKSTAAYLQKGLVTIDNPVANISAGRVVDVLWVYNNPVSDWQNAITDPGIKADLAKATDPTSPLWNFPSYNTFEQFYLDAEAVNMLAQLSAWNVQQISGQIAALMS